MGILETRSAADIFHDVAKEAQTGTDAAARMKETIARIDLTSDEAATDIRVILNTAQDLENTVGDTKIGELPAGVAGQVYQGMEGSSVIDLANGRKEGGESLVDVVKLKDVKAHEKRHEIQASSANASAVIYKGNRVSWYEISEFDAMEEQETLANVSDEYRRIHDRVAWLIGHEKARAVALSGDMASLAA